MQTMTLALIELVLDNLVEREIAENAAPNRHDFIIALEHAEKLRAAAALNPKLVQQDDGRPAEPAAADGDNEHSLRLVRVPGAAG